MDFVGEEERRCCDLLWEEEVRSWLDLGEFGRTQKDILITADSICYIDDIQLNARGVI